MNRPLKDPLRTCATVAGIAASLMVLGYTGQSTDGFVHASFAGPLGLFGPDSVAIDNDVIAIGNGPSDAAAIASLLKATAPSDQLSQRSQSVFEAGSATKPSQANAVPTQQAPAVGSAGPAAQPVTPAGGAPVVDAQGKIDCTGAVSCLVDPKTNVTTVTYSDGTVATVQRINGLTMVAYQNANGKAQNQPKSQVPTMPSTPIQAPVAAKPAPSPLASVSVPAAPATAPETPAVDSVPVVNPGPAAVTAPSSVIPDISASTARPRVTVSQPPQDYTPSRPSAPAAASTPGNSSGVSSALDAVRSAVDSVVGAVGKAVNPGASTSGKRATNNQG